MANITYLVPFVVVSSAATLPADTVAQYGEPEVPLESNVWPAVPVSPFAVSVPEILIVFAYNSQRRGFDPSFAPSVFDTGLIPPTEPDVVMAPVPIATLIVELPTLIVVALAKKPLEAPIVPTVKLAALTVPV